MIQIVHPEALILVPLWLLVAWWRPSLGLLRPLRALMGMLLLLLWLDPRIPRQGRGTDLWLLLDQSASAEALMAGREQEILRLLEEGRGRHDRLLLLDYAEDISVRENQQMLLRENRREATRTASAIHYALSQAEPDRATRLLVVSDGYSTEPLEGLDRRLSEQGIPLDLRLLGAGVTGDTRLDRLQAPVNVQPAEPFLIEAHIAGAPDAEIPYTLWRDDTVISRGNATLDQGRAVIRVTDALTRPGATRYRLRIEPVGDLHPGNNMQSVWVEMLGGPRILLVSAYPDDPLATLLRRQGFEVELAADPSSLHPGRLAGAKAVILNNIPAYALPPAFLAAIPFHIREQGAGLLIGGGRHSFAAGGYFDSPVDALLPVSMELKQDHRRLTTAMAIVLDRSGSMMAGVPGSSGTTKMDLANQGAAQAVELLGDRDAICVFAVDTQPHSIVPLSMLGGSRTAISDTIRSIRSAGGGIFVYTGLKRGWEELQGASQGQRHIILFADACDAEEPGNYQTLLKEITDAGASVSVIGMGTDSDVDAAFLIDVARLGNGRMLFNDDATTLPSLFAQETVALSRSAFIDEPTAPAARPGWMEIAARPLTWPAAVDGYNLNYLREGASVSLASTDEYDAPLIAHWNRGAGRVAAVAFPLAGAHAALVQAWPDYADLVQTLARWLMGAERPPGLGLRTRHLAAGIEIDLLYDDTWIDRLAARAPDLVTAIDNAATPVRHAWRRIEPGRYTAWIPLPPGGTLRGAVQLDGATLPFGPIAADSGPEWQFDHERLDELRLLEKASGGEERLDLDAVWQAPVRRTFRDLRAPLCILLAILFLADALLDRLGGRRPAFARPRNPHLSRPQKKPLQRPVLTAASHTHTPKPPETTPKPPTPDPRRTLFDQAKKIRPR